MLLLLLTPTITTRTSQFHKFFWLLFVLICFPIQNSLCQQEGPTLNNEESTTLLPNQVLQNQSEAVDVNVSEVPVSNNVTESSIVTNNTTEVETTTGNDDSTETETPTPGASEVTESNVSPTNSSSDLLPPTSNSINSTLDALQNNTNNATEAPSDQISQSSDGTEDTVNDIDELRRQMIIITSILGGVVVLTLMLVLALAVSISKMKAKFSNKHERYLASTPDTGAAISPSIRQNRQQEIHAYDNSAFNSGGSSGHEMEERRVDSKSEVERLGYEMYNGKNENRLQQQRSEDKFEAEVEERRIKKASAASQPEKIVLKEVLRYTAQLPRASTLSGSTPSHQLRMDEGVAPMSQATPTRENYNRRSGSDERAYRY